MNKSDFKCVIMIAWTVETSDCRDAVAFLLSVRHPVICGQQDAVMRSVVRLSKQTAGAGTKGGG